MESGKEKRILVFSLAYEPFLGGAELALKEIIKRNTNIKFDLITLRFDSNLPRFEQKDNLSVYRVGFSKKSPIAEELVKLPMYLVKVFYPILACLKALSLHKKNNYHAMWSMMAYAGFAAALFKLFKPDVRYALTLQEGDTIEHMTGRWRIRAVYPILKMVFTKPQVVQAISGYLGQFARSMGYVGQVEVIPNGVDIKKFKAKEKPEKNKDEIVLITTSRLVEKNALDDVIKSLKYLSGNVVFEILGIGPLEKALKSLAFDLGLGSRVRFRGYIDHDMLSEHLHKADIFIRPSLSEGMGSSFIEAMAASLPVIATPVGGIVDFLFDHSKTSGPSTGLFCEVRNPKSIAEKITMIIQDKSLRDGIVENASKMVIEKYDWDLIAKDMREKVFNKIL